MDVKNNQNENISDRITIARKNLGISMSKLSENMCLSRGMCRQWERGISNPSTAHLLKLAEVLQVSFEWLATGNNAINNNQTQTKYKNQDIIINKLVKKFNAEQKDRLINFLYVVK